MFNENMVSTAILMTLFFSVILMLLGKPYLVEKKFLGENASFFFYVLTTSFNFAVFLAILQLGVRTFVTELTQSFQGISQAFLPGSVPGVDCAVTYGFGAPNAVTIVMKYLSFAGLALVVIVLVAIPQLQYRKNKDTYFLVVEDYEAYKKKKGV